MVRLRIQLSPAAALESVIAPVVPSIAAAADSPLEDMETVLVVELYFEPSSVLATLRLRTLLPWSLEEIQPPP
jgi:hypothetical protein